MKSVYLHESLFVCPVHITAYVRVYIKASACVQVLAKEREMDNRWR